MMFDDQGFKNAIQEVMVVVVVDVQVPWGCGVVVA
jgi:hypothetical protein